MTSLITSIRQIIGAPSFYSNGYWDFGLFVEYLVCCFILLVVVSSVFKILVGVFNK